VLCPGGAALEVHRVFLEPGGWDPHRAAENTPKTRCFEVQKKNKTQETKKTAKTKKKEKKTPQELPPPGFCAGGKTVAKSMLKRGVSK